MKTRKKYNTNQQFYEKIKTNITFTTKIIKKNLFYLHCLSVQYILFQISISQSMDEEHFITII